MPARSPASVPTPLCIVELGAMISFWVEGVDSRTTEHALRATHEYRHVDHLDAPRIRPHIYTQKEDLDRFVEAIGRVVHAVT